jgi:hypothetical protein
MIGHERTTETGKKAIIASKIIEEMAEEILTLQNRLVEKSDIIAVLQAKIMQYEKNKDQK